MATVNDKIKSALTLFATKIKSTFVQTANVVNNCTSTSTTYPLSAKQGKVLQDQITELNTDFKHIVPVSITFSTNFTDNGASAGKFRYTKALNIDWNSYLPSGKTAKDVIFSHVVTAADSGNGLFVHATPYYANSTTEEQYLPTTWKVWCESNVYCYCIFFILY